MVNYSSAVVLYYCVTLLQANYPTSYQCLWTCSLMAMFSSGVGLKYLVECSCPASTHGF